MRALLIASIAVPVIDHAVKALLRARLAGRPLSLGVLGQVRFVQAPIWTMRVYRGLSLRFMWASWIVAAAAVVAAAVLVPASSSALGLLLGGALSHAIETSRQGSISDYVCLRYGPAFDLADVALAAGTLMLVFDLTAAVS